MSDLQEGNVRERLIEALAARHWDRDSGEVEHWVELTDSEKENVIENYIVRDSADAILAAFPELGRTSEEQIERAARAYDPEAWAHHDRLRKEGEKGLDGMVAYSLLKAREMLTAAGVAPQEPSEELRIEEDYSHIYWRDPLEGCWVAYRRADCVGEEELPPTTLAAQPALVPEKVAEVERAAAARALEEAVDGAPEAVEVFYRSSDIREAVNVLDQLNAEGRVDDFVYDEMRSAIEDIRDCEVVTAVAHDEHVDHSELIAEARQAVLAMDYVRAYQGGLVGRLADALEGLEKRNDPR